MSATNGVFSALRLREITLPNRIAVSPMDQYRAVDGCMGDWHLMHLGQFAKSGAGLIMTEAMHVEPQGRITHGCAGLYSNANEIALRRVLDFCRGNGFAKLGVQIAHSGRKGSTRLPWEARNTPLALRDGGWSTMGCSGLPYGKGWPSGKPLDDSAMERVTLAHADAARRAHRAGADLLEVVMAHGYLLHEFLSPASNHRNDAFGGKLENRLRFPLAVYAAVREAWPIDKPLGVRLSVEDHLVEGWSHEQTLELCRKLEALGCDFVCASSGGLSLEQNVAVSEGHQVPYAQMIRAQTGLATMAVGMIEDPLHAHRIVASGKADLVALARAFLSDPHWPWYAAAKLGEDVEYPPEYLRGYRSAWLRARRAGRTEQSGQRTASPHGSARHFGQPRSSRFP